MATTLFRKPARRRTGSTGAALACCLLLSACATQHTRLSPSITIAAPAELIRQRLEETDTPYSYSCQEAVRHNRTCVFADSLGLFFALAADGSEFLWFGSEFVRYLIEVGPNSEVVGIRTERVVEHWCPSDFCNM
jgi:hypothetical protein